MQSSNSRYVTFSVTLTKPSYLTIGPCKLWIRSNDGSGNLKTYIIPQIQTSGFTASTTLNYGYDFLYSDFNFNGGFLFAELVQDNQPGTKWSSNTIPVIKAPKYTLTTNPSSNSIQCGSNIPITFTITSNAIGNLYQWNVGQGWIYNGAYTPTQIINSNGNLVLTPFSFPLGSVSVTPLLNNIIQPVQEFPITLAPFTSNATILGATGICSGSSTYSLSGVLAGQTVSWSLSNPSIGSLSNSSNTGTTVTFNGNGAQTLRATIGNACGQTVAKQFVINTGLPTFASAAVIFGNSTFCSGSNLYTISGVLPGQTVSWSLSDTTIASLSGSTNTQTTVNFTGSGTQTLSAVITNSCGQTATKTFQIYGGVPTLTSFSCGSGASFCSGTVCVCASCLPSLDISSFVIANMVGQTTTQSNLASNWQWQRLNNNIVLQPNRNRCYIAANLLGETGVQVRARNSCGWSQWYTLNFGVVSCQNYFSRTSNVYSVFPNPSKDIVKIDLRDQHHQPEKGATISGELFDNLGISKAKVQIVDNKASFSVQGLNKGIYFLKIYINDKVETHQIAVE